MRTLKKIAVPVGLVALVGSILSFTNYKMKNDEKCTIKIIKIVNGVKTEVDSTFDCSEKMKWIASLGENDGDSICKKIKIMMDENSEEMDFDFDMKMLEGQNGVVKMIVNGKETTITPDEMEVHFEKIHDQVEIIEGEKGKMKVMVKTEGDEEQTVEVFKTIDDDGNVTVKKIVNGEEVELDATQEQLLIEMDDKKINQNKTMVFEVDVEADNVGQKKHVVIISKVIKSSSSENNKLPASVNLNKKELAVENLRFSPNPNNGKFELNFKLEKEQAVQVKIVDLQGKEVYNEMVNNFEGYYTNQIDISENKEGVYILQIIQGNKASTNKIVLK